ncbi:MAG: Mycofactocin system glycosyltransferase, partial [Acidimicrobiia bacterium]|nr:Mycofactocin system glycosyltransferase [Acidimicrobiia bacterium]
LAGRGQLLGGRAMAEAVRRTWWPIAAVACWRWPRARRAVAAIAAVGLVMPGRDEAQRPETTAPERRRGVGLWPLVDDLAYGAGVWVGCLRERSVAALRPRFPNR